MTFTQGGASLALGYFLTPLTGLCKEKGFLFWLLAPDFFRQPAIKSIARPRDIKGNVLA